MTLVEKILHKLFKHFDIVKPIPVDCTFCNGAGFFGPHDHGEGCRKCTGGKVLQDTVYLRRFYIVRSKYGNLYLHQFFRSDDDPDPHDHPWDFVTFVLSGGYVDQAYEFHDASAHKGALGSYREDNGLHLRPYFQEVAGVRSDPTYENVRPGRIIFRKATHVHRVQLIPGHEGRTWTLVGTGPEYRPWGFIKKGAWVFWRLYLGVWGDKHA